MILSIIIPYYNTLKETKKLFDVLIPQLTDDIEVILIDDGCFEKELLELPKLHKNIKLHILHHNSGTASKPRNVGLSIAQGKYIAFIDSDDLITDDYISEILKKIKKEPDMIYLSWKSQKHSVIIDKKPPTWNCAVWCRVYKRDLIKNKRFDESLKIAEDWVFNNDLKPEYTKVIKKQIYIYNLREGSLTRRK